MVCMQCVSSTRCTGRLERMRGSYADEELDRLFVSTFLDVAHDRDQNRSLSIPWLKIPRPK